MKTSQALREAARRIFKGSRWFYLAMPTKNARLLASKYLDRNPLHESTSAKVLFLLLLAAKLDQR